MNIAIFGGSFNPIHLGHIKLIEAIKNEFHIDKVLIIPTGITPHKSNREMVSEVHRYNMCKIATAHLDYVEVSDLEINRNGKSYTYLTLNSLKEKYTTDNLYLVVGGDMFLTLQDWKNPLEIFKTAEILAVPRNDMDFSVLKEHSLTLSKLGAKSLILKNTVMTVSSSEVRLKLKDKLDVSELLSKEVLTYIIDNNLYRV